MHPKKTQAGRPFSPSASFHNDLVETVKWVKSQRGLGGAGQQGGPSSPVKLMVKNSATFESGSGASDVLPAFSVLEISGRLGSDDDFYWLKTLVGQTPTDCEVPVVITQHPSKLNEIVDCVVAGATIAKVRVDSLGDRFASPIRGEHFLGSSYENGTFRILEPLTSTGVQRLLVAYHYSIPQICDVGSESSSDSSSESLCLTIPGVDMDAIPLVDAADIDYVLAIKDGCLVKVAVSQCDPASDAAAGSSSVGGGGGGPGLE